MSPTIYHPQDSHEQARHATGRYSYYTHEDGLCGYATLKAAYRNAIRAAKRSGIGCQIPVFSPSGRHVAIADWQST